MDALTRQDLDVLIEAVESWEAGDLAGEMIGSIFGSMASRDASPEAKQKFEDDLAKQKAERDQKRKVKKERGVMLRAKLIQLRDSVDATAFMESAAQ